MCDGNSGIKIFYDIGSEVCFVLQPSANADLHHWRGGVLQRDDMGMDKSCLPRLPPESSYHETVGVGNGYVEKIDGNFRKVHSSCVGTRWSFIQSVGRKEGR